MFPSMLQSFLGFVMELSLLYLLIALFVILDLLLLSTRTRRLRSEKTVPKERETRRQMEEQEQRKAFERRHARLPAAQ